MQENTNKSVNRCEPFRPYEYYKVIRLFFFYVKYDNLKRPHCREPNGSQKHHDKTLDPGISLHPNTSNNFK